MKNTNIQNSTLSYLALRKWLGILGLSLPLLIWVFNDFHLEYSISHFYYTKSSVLFTGYMIMFGIFLIFYHGRTDDTDKISDNWITSIGGFCAILTALIPTAYDLSCQKPLNYIIKPLDFCSISQISTQYMHNNSTLNSIHIFCAVLFLTLMGYMSFARFTKGRTSQKLKKFYQFCAIIVWLSILILGIEAFIQKQITNYDTFIFECIALFFFGIAWLVKGKTFHRFGVR